MRTESEIDVLVLGGAGVHTIVYPPHRCGLYGVIAGAYACTVPSTRTDSISRTELLARAAELSP
ncbi:hypothetical protein GCM10017771_02300 [Streptomyces capitiformicae]|uniref:Uncharacterized protein n=1 Tax=Streptomyces capitiformicae TaxID=2014920 RepID=A0A919L261_9ACTN|nr:hypothetical protein GCM10017771_02300 [Streptomyces capitiformicae]